MKMGGVMWGVMGAGGGDDRNTAEEKAQILLEAQSVKREAASVQQTASALVLEENHEGDALMRLHTFPSSFGLSLK